MSSVACSNKSSSSMGHLKLDELKILENKFMEVHEAQLAPDSESSALQNYQEQLEAFLGTRKKLPVLEHPPSPRVTDGSQRHEPCHTCSPFPSASSPRREVWLSASATDTDTVAEGIVTVGGWGSASEEESRSVSSNFAVSITHAAIGTHLGEGGARRFRPEQTSQLPNASPLMIGTGTPVSAYSPSAHNARSTSPDLIQERPAAPRGLRRVVGGLRSLSGTVLGRSSSNGLRGSGFSLGGFSSYSNGSRRGGSGHQSSSINADSSKHFHSSEKNSEHHGVRSYFESAWSGVLSRNGSQGAQSTHSVRSGCFATQSTQSMRSGSAAERVRSRFAATPPPPLDTNAEYINEPPKRMRRPHVLRSGSAAGSRPLKPSSTVSV